MCSQREFVTFPTSSINKDCSTVEKETKMITRKRLGLLALTTIVLFGLASLTRNDHHGAGGAVGFVFFWAFVVSALVLVVTSATILVRHRVTGKA